jgi:hypothetical protein
MKFRFIYFILFIFSAFYILQSRSAGPALVGLGDRTGSPVGGAAGCSCHGGGAFAPTIAAAVKDASLNTVTEYTPGQVYTIEFTVSSSAGTPGGYGFQALAISNLSGNANAGTMTSAITANTQVSGFGGRSYAEHSGFSTTGIFQVSWTAPPSGFGRVDIYNRGLAVDATGGSGGDVQTFGNLISLTEKTSISYAQTTYCENGSDPTPVIGGNAFGVFSAFPSGLAIVPATGLIDLSSSLAGQTYTVVYTYNSSDTTTTQMTITAADDATFSYGPFTPYCQNDPDPVPTITGLSGGTFSSITGLSINSTTGEIDLSATNPGIHSATYTTNGVCPDSLTLPVTIFTSDNAVFTYGGNTFCQNAIDPVPVGGTPGGTWSSTTGIAIDSLTGIIDLSASTPSTYSVTYTTNGACPDTNSANITISAADDASFTLNDTIFCQDGPDGLATIQGTTGGTFSSLTGLSINSTTGDIDVSASTPAVYDVTYTTSGSCPDIHIIPITIVQPDIASFTYGGNTFCQNAIDPVPAGGTPGGTWSSTTGIVIDSLTGIIDLSASTPATYSVTYTTNGACPDTNSANITINAADDASFTLNDTVFCQDGPDGLATILGTTGGTFSSLTGLSINSTTGDIDVSASTPAVYDVTYTTSGSCPDVHIIAITILAPGNAQFTYGGNTFCQNGIDAVAISSTPGGLWTSSAGLALDSVTGIIDVSASLPATYSVTYTLNSPCPDTNSSSLTILAADVASFAFTDTTICQNVGVNPVLSVTGTTSGTYSASPATMVFVDSTTGEIDLVASVPGIYVLTYISNGTCQAVAISSVTISVCGGITGLEYTEQFILYPNPNEGVFSLQNNKLSGEVLLVLTDVLGKVVYQKNTIFTKGNEKIIDLNYLPGGTYFIQLTKGNKVQTLKLNIR